MKRLLLYTGIGLIAFLAFVLVFAPASAAWLLIHDEVENAFPELRVYSVEGTIWSGSSQLQYQAFPVSRLSWRLKPRALLDGEADLDLTVSGEGLAFEGTGVVDSTRAKVRQLTGYLDSNYINTASQDYGLTFSGRLTVNRLALETDRQWLTAATGDMAWDGGRVVFQSGEQLEVLDLPPLTGNLSMDKETLRLAVHHQQASVLNVALAPTGWARVDLKGRLFQLADLEWPGDRNPDETVLQVEEKIFSGTRHSGP